MGISNFLKKLPFGKPNAEVKPVESDEEAQQRRLKSLGKTRQHFREVIPQAKNVSQPIDHAGAPAVETVNDKRVADLLSRRKGIEMFMNSSDSSGTTRERDAKILAQIDKQLKGLGYSQETAVEEKPAEIDSSEKAA